MVTRNEIVEQARGYLGTPFRHQGRTAQGLDCVGLLIRVAKDLDLLDRMYDYTRYGKAYPPEKLIEELKTMMRVKPVWQRLPGDILVFSTPYYPCHCAIFTGSTIVHAYNLTGKVTENSLDRRWKNHLAFCFAIPGVESCN